jgi:hypothetical protein
LSPEDQVIYNERVTAEPTAEIPEMPTPTPSPEPTATFSVEQMTVEDD